MIPKDMLGRYEYIDLSENHKKYWWLVYDKDTQTYIASWGRIGNKPQQKVYEGDATAMKKVKEKIKKGYEKKEGYETEIGCNATHFILTILEKETA